jgi:hypothetical protein
VHAVKVVERNAEESFAGRRITFEDCKTVGPDTFHYRLQRRLIKLILAAEVIVKKRFVDASCFGNLLRASPRQPLFTEFPNGSLEDTGASEIGAFGLGSGLRGRRRI